MRGVREREGMSVWVLLTPSKKNKGKIIEKKQGDSTSGGPISSSSSSSSRLRTSVPDLSPPFSMSMMSRCPQSEILNKINHLMIWHL